MQNEASRGAAHRARQDIASELGNALMDLAQERRTREELERENEELRAMVTRERVTTQAAQEERDRLTERLAQLEPPAPVAKAPRVRKKAKS